MRDRIDDIDDAAAAAGRGAGTAGARDPGRPRAPDGHGHDVAARARAARAGTVDATSGALDGDELEMVLSAVVKASRQMQRRHAAAAAAQTRSAPVMATVVDVAGSTAPAALRGTISVPSDKSIAHRALICAALAEGEATISLREPGGDVRSTVRRPAGPGRRRSTSSRTDRGRRHGVRRRRVDRATGWRSRRTAATRARRCGCWPAHWRRGAGTRDADRRRVAQPPADGARRRAAARDGRGHRHDRRPRADHVQRPAAAARASTTSLPVASAQVLGAISLRRAGGGRARRNVSVPGPTRDHTERTAGAPWAPHVARSMPSARRLDHWSGGLAAVRADACPATFPRPRRGSSLAALHPTPK